MEGGHLFTLLGRGGAAVLDRRVAVRGEVTINGAFFTSAAGGTFAASLIYSLAVACC